MGRAPASRRSAKNATMVAKLPATGAPSTSKLIRHLAERGWFKGHRRGKQAPAAGMAPQGGSRANYHRPYQAAWPAIRPLLCAR